MQPTAPTQLPCYDQTLKWLLSQAPQAVVDLLRPGLTWRSEATHRRCGN